MNKKKLKKILIVLAVCLLLALTFSVTVFAKENTLSEATASTPDVATAIENTWLATKGQVKKVVNNVVFPVVDMILAVLFFVKVGTAYFEYRRGGQFEFTAPCILFACLVFTLTAPLYIWTII